MFNIKTKSSKCGKKDRINPAVDLFGEVPVTWPEVHLWVDVVTRGRFSDSNRFMWYVQNWDVVGKIKAIKLRYGTLQDYFLEANRHLYTGHW